MIPALVVPEVATTPTTLPASGSASRAAASAGPVSTWLSVGTTRASMSRIDSAFLIEECAWSLTAIRVRSPRPSPRFRRPTSRATVRADRLPAEPPETNTPPALGGMPARSAMSRRTWFSAAIAPAASRAEIPWMLEPETSMSNNREALVGAAGMNARKLTASELITCGARTSVHISITRCGSVPSAVIRPSSCAVSAGTSPGRSRGTGSIARRSCMAVRTMRVSRSSWVCMSLAMGAHRSAIGGSVRWRGGFPVRATVRDDGARLVGVRGRAAEAGSPSGLGQRS